MVNASGGTIAGNISGVDVGNSTIGTLDNAGLIKGTGTLSEGVYVSTYSDAGTVATGVVANLINRATGTITGSRYGLQLDGSTIGTLDNAGLIQGTGTYSQGLYISTYSYGTVTAAGSVASLTNRATGTIDGGNSGLQLSGGTIGTLANSGLIIGGSGAGIGIYGNAFYTYSGTTSTLLGVASGTIGSLVNASGATIAGGYNGLLLGGETVGTLDNAGLIEGTGTYSQGIDVASYSYGTVAAAGAVASLTNHATGTIAGGYNGLQFSGATIGTLANSGLIVGGSGAGIDLHESGPFYIYNGTTFSLLSGVPAVIGSLVNASGATIAGGNTGLQLSGGTIGTLSNGGVISGLTYAGIAVQSSHARIDTIINLAGGTIGNISGTVGAYGTSAAGIVNTSSSIGTIANSGAISGGIEIYGSGAVVGAIDNRAGGTISALNSGIWIGGSVGTLANAGLISSAWNIGVNVSNRQTLDALFNAATGTIDGIGIGGTISTIDNAGLISGGGTGILARQLTVVSVTLANNVQATTTSVRTSGVPVLHNSGLINGTLAGVANAGVMGLLDNSGTIVGVAGTGVANVGQSAISTSQSQPTYFHSSVLSKAGGTLGTLTNSGLISGALTGVANAEANVMQTIMTSTFDSVNGTYVGTTSIIAAGTAAGTVGVLVNNGTILGGTERDLTAGIGLDNGGAAAIIGTLTNTGLIRGGQTGILNAGTIGALINSGTIFGGVAAIRNTGTGLLDTITNSGLIAGNVLNQGARGLTVVGGAGSIFGTFAAGSNGTATLTNTGGDVVLAGGNVALGINMAINVGTHTVTNTAGATLRLDSLVSITGNYAQSGNSALLVNVASAYSHGGLQVSGAAAVTGGAIILNPSAGYSLVDGQSYTIVAAGDASSAYSGYTVVAPGHALSSMTTVVGGLTDLIVTLGSLNGGTIGTLGSGSSTTIGGGASTVGQVSGGTVTVTDGTPTLSTISGGSVNIGGGSATLGTVAGGTVNISGGNASVGQVSAGSITLGSGATISSTQTVNVSGGSLAVSGSVTSPVAVSGGTVAVGSGGIVNSSTSIQVSSGSLSISGGGIVASDQPLQVSGGSLNVAGVVAAPVQVTDAGATVSISSGGLVTQSVTASAGAMNVGGTITAPVSVSGAGATVSISSGGLVTQSVTASAGALSVGGTITAPVSVSGAGATVSISSGGLVTQSVTASAGALSVGGTITAPVSVSGAGATVSISSGGLVTQSVTASAGALNVGGTITAPVSVSGAGATVSISSGGLVTQSVTASAGSLNVGGTITAPVSVSGAGATVSISSGGLVTQSVTASAGSLNVGGTIAAPVSVSGAGATVSIASGGVVTQSVTASAGSVNVAGTITAPVAVSGGTVSLASGGTIVSSQPVQVTGGSLSISGNVNAPVQVAGTTVSASQIASATPVMTVDAGGTISQSVTVDAGKVSMNGTISGNVAIGSGGALRGSGVVTGQASVSGILAPGNSPGTLTFTTGLTQAAKSVLSIDIDGTGTGAGYGNYSRVLVTGGSYVIGSGAVLQPNLRGISGKATNTYTPGLGTDFNIVQAAGGVSGTFAGITQPSSGLLAGTQFTALYGSNAVDLYVTPTYGNLASLGVSANQQTMGRVVAGLTPTVGSDLNAVLKALYGLPTVGASLDALAQIGGSSQANIVAYSLDRGLAATQVLGQRLAAVRDGVAGGMQGTMQAQLVGRTLYTSMASGGDAPVIEDERGAAAGSAPEEGWHFWAQGLGAFTRVDSDGNAEGGHSNTGGGLFGGDRTVAPGVTLGLAGVLLQSTSGGSNETSSYGLSAYGNVDLGDGLFVTGNAGYTYDQYDTARTMGFGSLSRTAFGHTTGDELSAGVTAGYRVRVSNLTLEPQAGIQWLKVGRDGFTETGAGALNLVLQDLDATALQSSVGGRASASWKTDGGTVITPALRAAWLHDFRDRALTSQAALAGTAFAVTGPDTGANALGIGGGLTLQEGDNLNLYANYDGTLRRHETDHVFTAGFRLIW
ncbi:autotransporter domain-containing protein [Nitrospirillum pindoramense]|uniref:autotransporter domain-containing protein n=1 Tax=Nitrospirillum amazonense TaxID=28077 RepID=UPI0011A6EF63|nr:autotransporter domain-containing protein [Nitrospirillum amazonense]